jgi:hypothetical protein
VRRIKRRRRELEEKGQPVPADEELDIGDLDINDEQIDDLESSESEDETDGPPLIYVLNLVNTKLDQTEKRYLFS